MQPKKFCDIGPSIRSVQVAKETFTKYYPEETGQSITQELATFHITLL
jgi:hypothetical protein